MFSVSNALYSEYVVYARKNGLNFTPAETTASQQKINELMKSYIARNLYDSQGFYPIFLRTDSAFRKAVEELGKK